MDTGNRKDNPRQGGLPDRIRGWLLRRTRARRIAPPATLTALVVFEASDPLVAPAARQVGDLLRRKGYQVDTCGFFADRAEHPDAAYSHFNRKALNMKGQPRGPLFQTLESRSWRIIVGLHRRVCPPVQWLVQMLPAFLRIGPRAGEAIYDITLDGHLPDLGGFPAHLGRILETMQTPSHVHT